MGEDRIQGSEDVTAATFVSEILMGDEELMTTAATKAAANNTDAANLGNMDIFDDYKQLIEYDDDDDDNDGRNIL